MKLKNETFEVDRDRVNWAVGWDYVSEFTGVNTYIPYLAKKTLDP